MTLDLTVNLGNILAAATSIVAIIWGISRLSSHQEEFFRTLHRHEAKLNDHEDRLQDHGERLAALSPERRLERRR